jgi:hypothetical protein
MNRHDRVLYLFDDLLLVCKHTKNSRLEPRYVFNLLTIATKRIESGTCLACFLPSTEYISTVSSYTNLIDLINANGRLMLITFGDPKDLARFESDILEAASSVMDQENEKKAQLRKITVSRADKAKKALEDMYSKGAQSNQGWYKKFGSLREARAKVTSS